MSDQASNLRHLVEAPNQTARVITFASGKGGVGKSNLITNLAIAIAAGKLKVALLDVDLGLANLDILLGLTPGYNLSHLMSGQKNITEIIVPGPNDVMFIPGASGVSRLANLNEEERLFLLERFKEIEDRADLILIDTGAGLGDNVLRFALASHTLIVVTTPEPTARMDAYALIKTFRRQCSGQEVYILVNEASHHEAKQVYQSLSTVCQQHLDFTPKFLGAVPVDPHVPQSVAKRRPFILNAPRCEASVAVKQIANKLQTQIFPELSHSLATEPQSLFSRFFNVISRLKQE